MEKLELKHLAPYLPYRIKVKWYRQDDCSFQTSDLTISDYPFLTSKLMKPILRPLSDLDKPISHGCLLTPTTWWDGDDDYIEKLTQLNNLVNIDTRAYYLHTTTYEVFERLLAWHFDVFGLIDKRLAIDINTIK